ncbi:MAG: hypothetical protein G01um101418_916 [Parcubacteria group bacterium Gr01-1014_18]|nr:MAG: hypothetical protein Greene041636_895 [Parcubacteria group bacterium Greene0416_36]TSC79752.1 MAG: hypothetical protein G01um101418_916 [Parcubacteria group bacterium Gr01-1014_18]TSC97912.1 MAG: hypothetical protein Greene101420_947 [Parcubacteria group bacterium Greene1014_20]TSD06570.1 MAG: hypothetical protein Greene07142_779 [Parcubacteria group bacterium Greene0714_2]
MINSYLYHLVPENMKGSILFPLNELKDKHSELYNQYVKKYEGRKELMEQIIPALNCKWNDVLHMLAVNPLEVKEALKKTGVNLNWKARFYKIDPAKLNQANLSVYLYKKKDTGGQFEIAPSEWEDFKMEKMSEYAAMNPQTLEYYKDCVKSDRRCLPFVNLVHILYRGGIDVAGCEILEV